MMRRLLALALFAALPAVHAALPEAVSRQLDAGKLPPEALGALVLRGDQVLLEHNSTRAMSPASTMKLLTTLVGLEQLGPVFRGRTEMRTAARVSHGVLRGDLIVRGGADADLNAAALEHMLQSLRNQGITKIAGNLVFDRHLFEPARLDLGVAPFDEGPEWRYNVIPDALLINTNLLEIELRASDERLQLAMAPAMEQVSVVSDMALVDADCAKWEAGWKPPEVKRDWRGVLKVILHGSFPRNCARSVNLNVLDRHDYLDRLLRASWRRMGGSITGETIEAATQSETRVLAEHVSRTLPELVRDTNKLSDNTLARTIYLSLGSLAADPAQGSRALAPEAGVPTLARADAAVRAWLRAKGIADDALVIENGSGLSRSEAISPAQMAAVLQAGMRSQWAPEYIASLPIVTMDGTMRRRLKDSVAATRARLKSGTLNGVTAVAGYVPDANGEPCIVVAFMNHSQVGGGAGAAVLDALVDWVARSGAQ